MSANIDERIISFAGFGKRVSLNNNLTEHDRALNRRADLIITFIIPKAESVEHIPDTLNKTDSSFSSESPVIDLGKAEVGETIRLENINFYGGRHIWLPRSEKTLKQLLKTMQDNPTLEIEIQGHICCIARGDGPDFDVPGMPRKLSVNRAKAIYLYLISNGIDKSRLSYTGFGADRKLIRYERTEADRESNRRVEIKIVRK